MITQNGPLLVNTHRDSGWPTHDKFRNQQIIITACLHGTQIYCPGTSRVNQANQKSLNLAFSVLAVFFVFAAFE